MRPVDGTARIQTINHRQHPRYYDLIKAFAEKTGVPVLVNTSFNTRGEPIVCTPRDAVESFWTSPLDALVIGSFLLERPVGGLEEPGMSLAAITVVVPTYKRHALLLRSLEALTRQRLSPTRFEVIVADDAASPHTRELVEGFARQTAVRIRYVAVTGRHGPAAARNAGWRAAAGRFVAFTDDDCVPDPDWLRASLQALESGADAFFGRIIMPLPDAPTDYERDAAGLASAGFLTANCGCRRSALARIGGFDERFGAAWREDSDLYFSLLESGCRVVRAEAAVVEHPIRPAPWAVSLRQQKKTFFNALLYKKHRLLYRQEIPPMPWQYYAIVASAAGAALALTSGSAVLGWGLLVVWSALTASIVARRLRGTSRRPAHVAEMIFTSVLIPPLSLYWHVLGAVRYRTLFV